RLGCDAPRSRAARCAEAPVSSFGSRESDQTNPVSLTVLVLYEPPTGIEPALPCSQGRCMNQRMLRRRAVRPSSSPHLRVLAPAWPGRPSASLTWAYSVERRGVEPRVSWSQTRPGHRAVALDVRGCGSLLTRDLPHSDRPRPVYCNVLGDYAPLQQSPWTSVCISLALELSTRYQVHTRLRGPSPGAGSRTPTYGFGDRRASVTPHPSSGPSPTLPCRSPLQLIYQDLRDQSNRFSWVPRGLFGPCLAVLLC